MNRVTGNPQDSPLILTRGIDLGFLKGMTRGPSSQVSQFPRGHMAQGIGGRGVCAKAVMRESAGSARAGEELAAVGAGPRDGWRTSQDQTQKASNVKTVSLPSGSSLLPVPGEGGRG